MGVVCGGAKVLGLEETRQNVSQSQRQSTATHFPLVALAIHRPQPNLMKNERQSEPLLSYKFANDTTQ
jgi:hypothetical protein